jgi:hypothetical protein
MSVENYLRKLALSSPTYQKGSDVSIAPYMFTSSTSGSGAGGSTLTLYFDPRKLAWGGIPDSAFFLYGTGSISVTPGAAWANNYELSLGYTSYDGFFHKTFPKAFRATGKNPWGSRLSYANDADEAEYTIGDNTIFSSFYYNLVTDPTGSYNIRTTVTFQGWRVVYS